MSTGRGTRKRTSAVTNNVITNSKHASSTPNTTAAEKHTLAQSDEDVPNVLFAPDGRQFFPCKHCCKAFAFKRTLTTHARTCTTRVVEVSDSEDETGIPKKQIKTSKQSGVTPAMSTKNEPDVTRDNKSIKNDAKKVSGINILTNVVVKEKTSKVPVQNVVKTSKTTPKIQETPKKTSKTKTFSEQLASLSSSVTLTPIDKPAQEETLACKKCHQIFTDPTMLARHEKTWHRRKTIQLSPESLKIYDKVFMASNKNICPLCHKPQARMGWKRHLQTHSSEFKFFCGVCRKGFKRIDHKKAHEKRHIIAIDEV